MLLVIGCSSKNNQKPVLGKNKLKYVSDSIRALSQIAYSNDTDRNKPQFIEWLNQNGAFVLAIQYLEDTALNNPTPRTIFKGSDIAYEHGYYNKSLWFINLLKPNNETDSVTALFKVWRVYLDEMDVVSAGKVFNQIAPHSKLIQSNDTFQFFYITGIAMQYHNSGRYDSSIIYDRQAEKMAINKHLPPDFTALVYHRLANSYNDLLRKNLVHGSTINKYYQLAYNYYKKEIEILQKYYPDQKGKIGMANVTLNMLIRTVYAKNDSLTNYLKAFNTLVPFHVDTEQLNDYLFSYHPLYTSIMLTQISEILNGKFYDSRRKQYEKDCIYFSELACKLMDQALMEPDEDGLSFDLIKSFRQRNFANLLGFLNGGDSPPDNLKYQLLSISTRSKYSILYKKHLWRKQPDGHLKNILSCLYNLRGLQFLGKCIHDTDIEQYSARTIALIQRQNLLLLRNLLPRNITADQINSLQTQCKNDSSAIVNFSVGDDGIFISLIDKDTFQYRYVKRNYEILPRNINQTFFQDLKNNKANDYANISFACYKYLLADNFDMNRYRKIIIIPDEVTELIPFDALVTTPKNAFNWNELDYLGDNHIIYFAPTIQWLFDNGSDPQKIRISFVLPESINNSPLPYSKELGKYLQREYQAKIITSSQIKDNSKSIDGILHIACHTFADDNGEICLVLDSTKISPFTDKTIDCNMVILNACETSNGKYLMSEGGISLSRLFLSYGADAVLSSIYNIDNNSSSELLKYYYQFLYEGKSASESLHRAKLLIKDKTPEWANPYYWATINLIGKDMSFIR